MNWALVIGCDKYWSDRASLKGCVRDALAMLKWLKDVNGGGVPDANIELLLSPSSAGAQIPTGLSAQEATNANIQKAMNRLVAASQGQGERLFVHFAGHGVTGRVNSIDEPAIAPQDFELELTDRALSIRSIYEFFATTRISEQFFFFDACRNIPFEGEFIIGQVARPRRSDYSLRTPEQYVCYATSRGLKAVEMPLVGGEGGVFTAALMEGLAGLRGAKSWDRDKSRYVVTWNGLFGYVEASVTKRRHVLGQGPEGDLIQVPRQAGEQGSNNPILAVLPENAFAAESLTLSIDPAEAAPEATVTVILEDADQDLTYGPPAQSPNKVPLAPRSYTIRARAKGFLPRKRSWHVELYEPKSVLLEFDTGAPQDTADTATEPPTTRAFEPELSGPTRLVAYAGDPVAVVEIHDEAGKLVAMGTGSAEVHKRGWYVARAVTPDGTTRDELVELETGQQSNFMLPSGPAVSTLANELAEIGQFDRDEFGIHLAEEIGYVPGPSASLLVTLAAGVRLGQTDWGLHLQSLAEAVLPELERDKAVHIVLVDQRSDHARRGQSSVELQSVEVPGTEGRRQIAHGKVAAVGLAAFDAPPGAHLATVLGVFPEPLSVPVHVFEGRPVLVMIEVSPSGSPLFLQLASSLFEGGGHAEAQALRRFESAQRFVAAGQLAHAHEVIADGATDHDPLAGCLAIYLRLRLGKGPEVAPSVRDIAERTGLADAWILDGLLGADHGDRARLRESMDEAVRHGLPVFDIGMLALGDALSDSHGLHIEELTGRRVAGQVLTTLRGKDVAELATPRVAVLA